MAFWTKKAREEPVAETGVLVCQTFEERTVVAKPNGAAGYGGITVESSSKRGTVTVLVQSNSPYGSHLVIHRGDARAVAEAILKVLDGAC